MWWTSHCRQARGAGKQASKQSAIDLLPGPQRSLANGLFPNHCLHSPRAGSSWKIIHCTSWAYALYASRGLRDPNYRAACFCFGVVTSTIDEVVDAQGCSSNWVTDQRCRRRRRRRCCWSLVIARAIIPAIGSLNVSGKCCTWSSSGCPSNWATKCVGKVMFFEVLVDVQAVPASNWLTICVGKVLLLLLVVCLLWKLLWMPKQSGNFVLERCYCWSSSRCTSYSSNLKRNVLEGWWRYWSFSSGEPALLSRLL